ncbi:MAG: GerMN domain-containing protein [Patescibacteria group bacterium]
MRRRFVLVLFLFIAAAGAAFLIASALRRPAPAQARITVYFTDTRRFAEGTPPFEVPVTRLVPATADLPTATLAEFYKGPTPSERQQGLEAVKSGTTGFSKLTVADGIARVYLTGPCSSGGATYTVAQPIFKNLLQYPEIRYVKIYDANGETEEPEGPSNSIPFCLEP